MCRLFTVYVIVAVLLCGCRSSASKEQAGELRHRTIDMGGEYLGVGGFLACCGGSVVGLELSPAVKQPFFNLTREGEFYFFGSKGRGPGEFLMPYSIQYVGNRTVGVFDVQTRTYSEFTIPREGEMPRTEKEMKIESSSSRIIKTAFDQYIALLSLDEKMFSLIDSTGVQIDTFFEYPGRDAAERDDPSRAMAYQGTLAANRSATKFVYSSFRGEIIHFYSIGENTIELIAKIENEYPLYKDMSDGNIRGVGYDVNTKEGYIATCATDRFVYAVYSGKTMYERERSSNFEGRIVRVFDWEGSLVKEYGLDVPCSFVCASDDDKTMWAIATDDQGETVIVSFDLE